MSSLLTFKLNGGLFVALRSESIRLKFPHWSKCLPLDEGFFLPPGHESSEDLLFPLGRTDVFKKTSFLPIPKRGVEV